MREILTGKMATLCKIQTLADNRRAESSGVRRIFQSARVIWGPWPAGCSCYPGTSACVLSLVVPAHASWHRDRRESALWRIHAQYPYGF